MKRLTPPLNKQGGRADLYKPDGSLDNEAHMLGVCRAAKKAFSNELNEGNHAELHGLMKVVFDAEAQANEAALQGNFKWRNILDAGGGSILDYWDGSRVSYPGPEIFNPSNPSSRFTFLLYLGHAIGATFNGMFDHYFTELEAALEAFDTDDWWVVNSIHDLVVS